MYLSTSLNLYITRCMRKCVIHINDDILHQVRTVSLSRIVQTK